MAGVTSSYPAALDSESNLTPPNNGDTLSVADHWLAGNSGPIVAIETELGTDPAGSFTDVKSRLDDVDDKVITEIDQWYLTSSYSASNNSDLITSNMQRANIDGFTVKGTGLSYNTSTGEFTFPSTGYWKIDFQSMITQDSTIQAEVYIVYDNAGAGFSNVSNAYTNAKDGNSSVHLTYVFKVTNSSTSKFKFLLYSNSVNNMTLNGDSGMIRTGFNIVRLGAV